MEENKRIYTAKEEWDAHSDGYFIKNASERIIRRIIEDPSYWLIQDIFNAAFDAGFNITHIEEFHPKKNDHSLWFYKNQAQAAADNFRKFDWKQNPWAVLPQWIGFSAMKEV